MKSLKRALVTLLVLTMVLGMVSVASAGFPDVTDSNVSAAASKLAALGVLTGYPDGTFGPSKNITRAEFAAVAVRLLGLENAATYAKGATKFSDVGADHWASGYINVAADQGIIKGYPDGTFKPEANVTYAESLAMLIRVLGYEPIISGTWPTNYIVKAASLGLTTGISFYANQPATRGDVALFSNNSLNVPLLKQTVFGANPQWAPAVDSNGNVTESLLKSKLGATSTAGVLTSSPELYGVASDQIKVDNVAKTLASGVSVKGLLGHNVVVWEKNGKVFAIEDKTAASDVVAGTLKVVDAVYSKVTITVGTTDTTYSVVPSAVYVQNAKALTALGDLLTGSSVTAVLSSGSVQFLSAFKITNPDKTIAATTVKGVNGATANTLTVGSAVYTVVDNATLLRNGKAAAWSEFAKGDIVSFTVVDTDKITYASASNAKVEGTVDNVLIKTDGKTYVVIGGTEYGTSNLAVTLDGTGSNAGSVIGFKATAYLNADGKVVTLAANTGAVIGKVTAIATDGKSLTVDAKGVSTTVSLAANVNIPSGVAVGDLVRIYTNAQGLATSITEFTVGTTVYTVKAVDLAQSKVTVADSSNNITVLTFASDAAIKRGTSYVGLSGLVAGDSLQVYAPAGSVVYAEATAASPTTAGTVYGKYLGSLVDYVSNKTTVYVEVKGASNSYTLTGVTAPSVSGYVYATYKSDGSLDAVGNVTFNNTNNDNGYTVVAVNADGTITVSDGATPPTYSVLNISSAGIYDKNDQPTTAAAVVKDKVIIFHKVSISGKDTVVLVKIKN